MRVPRVDVVMAANLALTKCLVKPLGAHLPTEGWFEHAYPPFMFQMAVGHSDDVDLASALGEVFTQCDAGLVGVTPRAALLVSAWGIDHQYAIDQIRARYPGIELAGSSSSGEMSSVLGFREDSLALALFASDSIDIVVGLGRDLVADCLAAARQAVAEATAKTRLPPRLCIVLSAVGGVEAGVILDALRTALGPGVPIIGGGAAPRDPGVEPEGTSSREFAGDILTGDALTILLFAGPLAFSFGVQTGWSGVGPRATITRASDAGVLEIDGRPALDFYERYIGAGRPAIANPLAVFEDPDADRFYLRTPMKYDRERGSIAFFGAVPEGATVQLTMAGTDQIFEGARASFADALAGFPDGARPGGALLFSCATRKFLLGTRAGREIELAREVLGDAVPIGGFYCMGEIAPMASVDQTRFHNATMVSVLLGSAQAEGTGSA
jgi:hypothetical protein